MNRDNLPLRDQIAHHLDGNPESSAKDLAVALGKTDYPSLIVKALNLMRTDGDLECEQKRGDIRYWLAKPIAEIIGGAPVDAPVVAGELPSGIRAGTRAAQIWRTLERGAMTSREICTATGAAKGTIDPVLTKMWQDGFVARERSGDEPFRYSRPAADETKPAPPRAVKDSLTAATPEPVATAATPPAPQYDPDAVCFDPAKRAAAEDQRADESDEQSAYLLRILAEIRAAIGDEGQVELSELPSYIADAHELGAAHMAACLDWERSMMAAIGEDGVGDVAMAIRNLQAESANAKALAGKLDHLLQSSRNECEALRAQIDGMVSPEVSSIEPAGYLIKAPKRRPRTVSKLETAQAAAMAAARNGSGRGDVYALVPVGTARRGAEWSPA